MKRSSSNKLKGVSWTPQSSLRQDKIFLPEDSPTELGENQDNLRLQQKTFSTGTSANEYDYELPPGFEGYVSWNQPLPKAQLPNNPMIKWECPPSFLLSPHWRVAAGEESTEKNDEKLRELRELEAIYPRISAIPPGPFISFDEEKECYDDSDTPVISLIPQIKWECPPSFLLSPHWQVAAGEGSKEKDDEKLRETRVLEAIYPRNSAIPSGPFIPFDVEVEKEWWDDNLTRRISLIPIEEQESVGDIKPHVAVTKHAESPTKKFQSEYLKRAVRILAESPATTRSVSSSYGMLSLLNTHSPRQRVKREAPLASVSSTEMHSATKNHVAKQVWFSAGPVPSQPAKDVNYYKNHVRSHGTRKQEGMQSRNNFRDLKGPHNSIIKKQTPCKYYNSSKGCRNGSNCPYQHDEMSVHRDAPCKYYNSSRGCRNGSNCPYQHNEMSVHRDAGNVSRTQNAKRFKTGPEIPWRM